MKIGVAFPQTEIGGDRGAVRAYAQRVEELGFSHVLAYDHVLGADPAVHQGWNGPYDVDTTFHEPFVLFGYLAALTSLELVTGIIILPQRQTALVAKQAAEVDMLTGGKFRLGIGLGWNAVEYEALGKKFADRGRRIAEQVELHAAAVDRADGDVQRTARDRDRSRPGAAAGSAADPGLVRRPVAARLHPGRPARGRLVPAGAARAEAGRRRGRSSSRRPGTLAATRRRIGMEGRVSWGVGGAERLIDHAGRWRAAGASHLSVNTMGAGLGSVDGHLKTLTIAAEALELNRSERTAATTWLGLSLLEPH